MLARLAVPLFLPAAWLAQTPAPYRLTQTQRQQIVAAAAGLEGRIESLRRARADDALLADVEVFDKAARWILRFEEEFYTADYVTHTLAAIDTGLSRALELEAGKPSWPRRTGRLIRGYRSKVDASVQPYAVHVPDGYDPARPTRLDVVLHGRGATLNEVSFIASREVAQPPSPDPPHIQLHVFGRTNNAYRWAGETDVFEALDSVRSRYNIDPDRIVLRGFSMGGAGAWHIGLHYPDLWAAIEAGAGFTETRRYARLAGIPPWQEPTLRIYDAVEYAPNAFNVPIVGYGGEDDPQLRASLNIRERLAEEGFALEDLRALFLVGPKTGHRWHPDSRRASNAFIDAIVAGERRTPDRIRFVTYTTRYNRCFWITISGLERHFERAEVDARRTAGKISLATRNVAGLRLAGVGRREIEVDGQTLPTGSEFLRKSGGKWFGDQRLTLSKKHGLQGPIDDAFLDAFLCVRPSGAADAGLDSFARRYAKWMRGDVRVKDAAAVTRDDMANYHLVLFGEPSRNRLLARIAPHLPIVLGKRDIRVGPKLSGRRFSASEYRLSMIFPNPLNPERYVVVNSGHTFGDEDFLGTNALLYPRLGDWAVRDAAGNTAAAGFFDESWRLLAGPGLR